ncbi:putative membrane protein [Caulobacter ginsengisoli]|uniref:Membrane protein n=1 Tax=Caulobacter ginsengisoli TaxID=400775 RepID=A0ABU0ISG0_9CAUL|nr:DUF2306 domain-containing protein [Caulobacter ginsengisoli]MDQ0463964.1 putative membrane protein [Caulobacter ginsengisoli]
MIKTMAGGVWWSAAMLLSLALAIFSYRYLPGIGPLAPPILANLFAKPWLDLHIVGAATALLLGSFQFLPVLRRGSAHRWIGRTYALGCLIGGAGGLALALGTTAGPAATLGFGSLDVLWIAFVALGWRAAVRREFVAHRRWMIRGWALTLAAITLRLLLLAIPATGLPPVAAYCAASFLCWIPNLAIAEAYLRLRPR